LLRSSISRSLGAATCAVLCLLATTAGADGTLTGLWSRRVGRSLTVSPALAPGRVFVVATDGRVQCLRLSDGEKIWARKLKETGEAAPAWSRGGTGGRLFVSSGEEGNVLQALDATEGDPAWHRDLSAEITAIGADDSVVVVLTRRAELSAWRGADGAPLWTRSLRGWDPPPFLLRDGLVYAASRRDSLFALDARRGAVTWRSAPGGRFSAGPVLAGGLLVVAQGEGALAWIDPATGEVRARTERSAWQLQAGAAAGDGLVTVSSGGRAEWTGVNPGGGDWATDLESAVVGTPLVRGDAVLVGGTTGKLAALDLHRGQILWSFQSGGGFRTGPLAAGDTLLLADTKGMIHVYRDGRKD
jgi:outer membrane protein assembly factor BamB